MNVGNLVKISAGELKGIRVHDFKYEQLGKNTEIKLYNLYKEKGNPEKQLYLKTSNGEPIETYTNMEQLENDYSKASSDSNAIEDITEFLDSI